MRSVPDLQVAPAEASGLMRARWQLAHEITPAVVARHRLFSVRKGFQAGGTTKMPSIVACLKPMISGQ